LGRLRSYFAFSFAGIFGLAAAFAALPWLADRLAIDNAGWDTTTALWNSALVGWVVVLIRMRSRQNPRRDWAWTTPIAFLLVAVAWLRPMHWSLALVYVHPLMALWIFDRELTRRRIAWRGAFRVCVACLPIFLGVLWLRLNSAAPLAGDDAVSFRIANHAGAPLLPGVSSHLLIATHAFLEMIHYSVWLIAIPLVGISTAPWNVDPIPLARRSAGWRSLVVAILTFGLLAVVSLWIAFAIDYPLTRDVYFTVALLHVLAEVPFLLRAL
jgi:hypothetical protein